MSLNVLTYALVALMEFEGQTAVQVQATAPDTLVWGQVAVLYDASVVELGNFKGQGGFTLEGVFYDVIQDGRARAKVQFSGPGTTGPVFFFEAVGLQCPATTRLEVDLTPEVSNAPTHGITTGPWVMYSAFYGNLMATGLDVRFCDGQVPVTPPTWGAVRALWR